MKISRIFLTLRVTASSGFQDNVWGSIFYETLCNMGYDVDFYPYDEAKINDDNKRKNNISQISENIFTVFAKKHKTKPYDLFLSYYHSGHVTPELFKRVRELAFCLNYTTNFHQIEQYRPLLKEASLSIYASQEASSFFSDNNFNGYYMPFAGLKKYSNNVTVKNKRVSFIGTAYGNRPYYLWRCLQNQLPIDIYGANWGKNHHKRAALRTLHLAGKILNSSKSIVDTAYRSMNDCILMDINKNYNSALNAPLPDKEYFELLANSSIVLNFPESRYNHDFLNHRVLIGANLRDFEVPMAGSLLLTQDSDEIKSCFKVGKEIDTFCNEWEMIDKINFYLKNPDLSNRVSISGYNRVLKEHLWEHRFKALFKHLESNFL